MSNVICHGLRSPIRSLSRLRKAKAISTSIVHNETILVKNNDEFVNKVMNSEKPVIVNFHADWCEPCKILTPKLKELIEPLDNLDLAVVDVEDNAELVHTFEVWSDLKNNTKRKKARILQSANGTGGGPATKLQLTDLEDRVLNIIGPQAATGIPEVPEIGLNQVKAVPAVIAIKNGLIVDKFIGLVDADMITGLIDKMSGEKKPES